MRRLHGRGGRSVAERSLAGRFRRLDCRVLCASAGSLLLVGVAKAELRVDAVAAWDGVARAGAWTEVRVRVVSDVGGDVALESRAGALHSDAAGRVEAGVPAVFRLPVRVGTSDRIVVAVRGPGGVRRRVPVALRLLAPDERVVARVGNASELAARGVVVLRTDAAALPATAQAFEVVDVLALEVRMLAALEGPQLAALESHLAACGRVVLIDAPPAAVRRARERAGCGGAFVAAVADGAAAGDAVRRLVGEAAPPLPDARRLAAVLPDGDRPAAARPLAGFFVAYAAALALGAMAIRRAWLAVALPVAATALLAVALATARPAVALGSWTETTSGTATARFAAVLRVSGMAPRALAIAIPPALGLPEPADGASVHLVVGADGETRVDVRTALLSEHRIGLRGTIDWTSPLVVDVASDPPRVENTGRTRSRAGFLVWAGRAYAMPPLEPAAAWTPTPGDARAWTALPAALGLVGPDEVFALLPGTPGPMLGSGTATAGWIVIRPGQAG